jgi:hypothetical protein
MIINETIIKNVSAVVCGFVVEIERKGENYIMKMTPITTEQTLKKNQIYELLEKIKLLVETASK